MMLENNFIDELTTRMDFIIAPGDGIKRTLQIFAFRIIYCVHEVLLNLKGHFNQTLIFFKLIYFTETAMRNSFLVHFILQCFKMELERSKCSTLFPQYLINEI